MSDFVPNIRLIFIEVDAPLVDLSAVLRLDIGNIDALIQNEQRFHQRGFTDLSPVTQDMLGNLATYLKRIREFKPTIDLMSCINTYSFVPAHEAMQQEKARSPNTIPTWQPTEIAVAQFAPTLEDAQVGANRARAAGYHADVFEPNVSEEQVLQHNGETLSRSLLPVITAALNETQGLSPHRAKRVLADVLTRHGFTHEEAASIANDLPYYP